jgi:hypothetical protein
MVAWVVALIAEKCSSWCTDKLTATSSVLSMVVATAAGAHVIVLTGRAQRAIVVAHGKLLPPSPAPVQETLLSIMSKLLPLLPRTCEAGHRHQLRSRSGRTHQRRRCSAHD